jgi:hypothetical protein
MMVARERVPQILIAAPLFISMCSSSCTNLGLKYNPEIFRYEVAI